MERLPAPPSAGGQAAYDGAVGFCTSGGGPWPFCKPRKANGAKVNDAHGLSRTGVQEHLAAIDEREQVRVEVTRLPVLVHGQNLGQDLLDGC